MLTLLIAAAVDRASPNPLLPPLLLHHPHTKTTNWARNSFCPFSTVPNTGSTLSTPCDPSCPCSARLWTRIKCCHWLGATQRSHFGSFSLKNGSLVELLSVHLLTKPPRGWKHICILVCINMVRVTKRRPTCMTSECSNSTSSQIFFNSSLNFSSSKEW